MRVCLHGVAVTVDIYWVTQIMVTWLQHCVCPGFVTCWKSVFVHGQACRRKKQSNSSEETSWNENNKSCCWVFMQSKHRVSRQQQERLESPALHPSLNLQQTVTQSNVADFSLSPLFLQTSFCLQAVTSRSRGERMFLQRLLFAHCMIWSHFPLGK